MYRKFGKRLFDVLFSASLLIVLSPVILIIALIVYVKMGRPILFSQERPGLNEKIFTLYKFRTMTNAYGPDGKLLPDSSRLSRFGKILRSTSLDELPELWNILKGDMSFVGPRPLLVQYLSLYSDEQRHRHDVRPGLTGLAMIHGRNNLNWNDKFAYDLQYVEQQSFLLDMKILLWTVVITLKREGITEKGEATVSMFTGSKKNE
ncbi:sugar transferase [Anaerotruncus colihominis]|uniref:Sugar transferase n=1 Tax=Anaerotruncus colihominis TaxID=169435 RepID=A0A3E3IPE4_9FIRM|nr:sugar transferase [Anaerotruncus colihominis]MBS4987342.1 sugar transferase [Anaerotruncus colihominis]MCQ4731966.1 sugar transferase [Anaerotruncus colihominis]RGE68791.1 sugar transferase [Anaerotruncus colihominis]